MNTGGLDQQRAARLLATALHEADDVLVDMPAGRARLAQRSAARQKAARRRLLVACVATSVLAVVVIASIVFIGLRRDARGLPAGPTPDVTSSASESPGTPAPGVRLSPSGLPVGLLVGKVDRTEAAARSTVRILVRSDGTGTWSNGTVGDSQGSSGTDYDVRFERAGPGRTTLVNESDAACFIQEFLTLTFTVRGHAVVIEDARPSVEACDLILPNLVADMPGTTLRILPLPRSK
ncbi:MAG: hypothetical protein QOE01_245 [Actinomycetota bacterium]|jgi:hypothetical protein|nr:hypothetical protein [Actinomycetota bacterium]